jgi:hypothetical protein
MIMGCIPESLLQNSQPASVEPARLASLEPFFMVKRKLRGQIYP